MIGIINYGMGNLGSIVNVLNYLKIPSKIISNYGELSNYEKFILPGVGAFGMAMKNLRDNNYVEELNEQILTKNKPILGICLGMQLLLDSSEEFGLHKGLGYVKGEVKNFKNKVNHLPIPHVGWNEVEMTNNSRLITDRGEKKSFYFVHSFYCDVSEKDNVTGICSYDIDFDVLIEKGNIMGCQFHPEKSQLNGMNIYKAFHQI